MKYILQLNDKDIEDMVFQYARGRIKDPEFGGYSLPRKNYKVGCISTPEGITISVERIPKNEVGKKPKTTLLTTPSETTGEI